MLTVVVDEQSDKFHESHWPWFLVISYGIYPIKSWNIRHLDKFVMRTCICLQNIVFIDISLAKGPKPNYEAYFPVRMVEYSLFSGAHGCTVNMLVFGVYGTYFADSAPEKDLIYDVWLGNVLLFSY